MVPTNAGLLALATDCTKIGTSSVPFCANALLKLVNNSIVTLNGGTTWGSVSATIGGYDGYADDTITWQAPSTPDAGGVVALSNTSIFRPTDATYPQQMFGMVLTDPGSASVLFAGPFDDPPIPLQNNLDVLQVTLQFNAAVPGLIVDYIS